MKDGAAANAQVGARHRRSSQGPEKGEGVEQGGTLSSRAELVRSNKSGANQLLRNKDS